MSTYGKTNPSIVLIVEDDRSIAQVVAQLVLEAGATPLVAANGQRALELARCSSPPPAVVITDLMMPRLDGKGLVRAMRVEAAEQDQVMPPVILITAADPAYAREVGADALVRKPFDFDELDALLHHYLD